MTTRTSTVLIHLSLLAIFHTVPASAQPEESKHTVDDRSRLLFPPLRASVVEARIGACDHANTDRLRLDIGNSVDLVTFQPWEDPRETVSIGADFFTWTSLRRSERFHFPVDAVDYLFGVNAAYRRAFDATTAAAVRLRISHISAHLVDGSFDQREGAWRDARTPRVYSREFIELVMALEFLETHRVYLGMQYIYHVDPPVLGATAFQAGGEAMVSPGGMKWLHAYAAYDLKLTKYTAWTASHSVQAGVKLGSRNGAGVNLFIAAFNGTSQHGEYYDQRWSYWGPGFSVEF